MAELLNQKEIDELLAGALGESEAAASTQTDSSSIGKSHSTKKFSYIKDTAFKYKYAYSSPVIKRERILFNPDTKNTPGSPNKIIVLSLDQYTNTVQAKKRSDDFITPFSDQ